MPVAIASQVIEITEVGEVSLTEAVQDPETGDWVREFRVYGKVESGQGPLIHTTRVVADLDTDIRITTPALNV